MRHPVTLFLLLYLFMANYDDLQPTSGCEEALTIWGPGKAPEERLVLIVKQVVLCESCIPGPCTHKSGLAQVL